MQGQEIWGDFRKFWLQIAPAFLTLLVLGLIYALPIMLDGRYYLDDLPRAMTGLTLWEKDGRPLASILSSLISFSWPSFSGPALQDTSPIPQMLGVAALAYGAARLARKLFPDGVGLVQALVVFPVIGSPFMLQNLSYKYDAFTMGVAVTLALIAAVSEATWLVAALVMVMLLTYQAAFNVFIGAAALVWLVSSLRGEDADFSFVKKLGWGIAALLVYGIATKLFDGLLWPYAQKHAELVGFNTQGFDAVLFNFGFGSYFVIELLVDAPLVALGLAGALFAGALRFAQMGEGRRNLLRFVVTLGIIIISMMGVLLFLQSAVVRPRTLMGFSIFLTLAYYCAHEALKSWPGIRLVAFALVTGWFFALANVYANAARDETRFDTYLSTNIIHDLLQAGFKPGGKLAFDGVQPLSPVAAHAAQLKIIAHVLQPNMNGNSEWGFQQLAFLGLATTPIMDATDESLKALCADGPGTTNPQYQIFIRGETMVVAFPKGVCFRG
jgi:Glucosyl transferase GtrII